MRQGSSTEEGQVLLHARVAETWCHLKYLNAVIMFVYIKLFNNLLIIFINYYLLIYNLNFVLLASCYLLAFENENQFTLALVLINNAELNDCVYNRVLSRGKFIYIR